MSDIAAFIGARLDEDEAAARAVPGRAWYEPDDDRFSHYKDAAHIARHDPARVLREVTAKRAILTRHSPVTEPGRGTRCGWCSGEFDVAWPCEDARSVAAIWSDHPDYQEGWKP